MSCLLIDDYKEYQLWTKEKSLVRIKSNMNQRKARCVPTMDTDRICSASADAEWARTDISNAHINARTVGDGTSQGLDKERMYDY